MSLARNEDPFTSHEAPSSKTSRGNIAQAVRGLFDYYGPMTDEQLVENYLSSSKPLPKATPQGIRSRRAELVRAGDVRIKPGVLGETATGRRCLVWELAND